MIEYLLIIIPLVYHILIKFINRRSILSIKLEKELDENNIYIITDSLYKNKEKFLFLGIFYNSMCELCNIPNIIDVTDENDIKYMINKIEANSSINFILDSNTDENSSLNLLNFLIKRNNIKIKSYIPVTTKGSSVLLALSSNELFLNWNSYLSPLTNLTDSDKNGLSIDYQEENQKKSILDYNDINFLIQKFFTSKKYLINKIRNNFLLSSCSNIFYDHKDLKKLGFPVQGKISDDIKNIYQKFKLLKIK
jgi:hypothetical protein